MSEAVSALVELFSAGFVPKVPPPYDLRALCRGAAGVPTELPELPPRLQLRVLEPHDVRRVACAPATVVGAIDGVQPPARVLTWREGRPIGLLFAAAGCLGPGREPLALEERLLIVASHLDAQWAEEHSEGVPVATLPERFPAEIIAAITELHRRLRHRLERDVLAKVRGKGLVVVDGHLGGVPVGDGAVAGIVKSHPRQYLGDESAIQGLRAGERSGAFLLPAPRDGEVDRYAAFLRLHSADAGPWTHGLIRIEATARDLLEPVAAWALTERQGPGADRRWDVHLGLIAACERALRARVPAVVF